LCLAPFRDLLKSEVHLNIRDSRKRSLLHYAAFVGDSEITQFLIQKRIDLYAEDSFGKTAFDVAFEAKHYQGDDK